MAGAGSGAPLHGEERTHRQAGQREQVDRTHRAHTGQRGDTIRYLPEEGDPPVSGGIPAAAERDADGQYVSGLKAGVHAAQPDEALDQEAGTDQHDHRQRDFGNRQSIAQAASGTSGGAAAADFIERHAQTASRALHGGRQAEENPCRQGNPQGEREQPQVDGRLRQSRHAGGPGMSQNADCHHGQQQTQGAASKGQEDAFGEKLRDDASAARTQGGTERDFLAAGGAARQKEVGDVHAGHQQEASHGGHQHPKRTADASDQFVIQDEDRRAPPLIQGGQGLFHLRSDGIEFGAHLFEGTAAARDHGQEAVVDGARIAGVEGQGKENVDAGFDHGKSRRQYTNDGVGLVAQADGLARNGWIGAETALP